MSQQKKFTIRRIFEAIGEIPVSKATHAFIKTDQGDPYERSGLPVNIPIGAACAMGNAAIALRVSPEELYDVLCGAKVDGMDYDDAEKLADRNIGDAIADKNDNTSKSLPVLANFFRRHFADVLDIEVSLTTYEEELQLKKLDNGDVMLVAAEDPWFIDYDESYTEVLPESVSTEEYTW